MRFNYNDFINDFLIIFKLDNESNAGRYRTIFPTFGITQREGTYDMRLGTLNLLNPLTFPAHKLSMTLKSCFAANQRKNYTETRMKNYIPQFSQSQRTENRGPRIV